MPDLKPESRRISASQSQGEFPDFYKLKARLLSVQGLSLAEKIHLNPDLPQSCNI